MINTKKKFSTFTLAVLGLMAALVFVASHLSLPIPTAIGNTRIHLGNIFCLLAGLVLGPIGGGLAAGIGSFFFDLTNPLYIASAPFTFAFKFLMGFICGLIAHSHGASGRSLKRNILACSTGAFAYVLLYVGKNFLEDIWFLRTQVATAILDAGQKGLVSGVNAILAVVCAVPIMLALRAALDKTPMGHKI